MSRRKSYIDADGEAKDLDAEFFREARRGRPPLPAHRRKQKVTIMLDSEIVQHFKAGGPGWRTRVNAALARTVRRAAAKPAAGGRSRAASD